MIDTVGNNHTDTAYKILGANLFLGNYRFLAGSFVGRAINIGINSPIPDTAILTFAAIGCDSTRIIRVPNGPYECNDTITGQMLEHRVAVPLKSDFLPLGWEKSTT